MVPVCFTPKIVLTNCFVDKNWHNLYSPNERHTRNTLNQLKAPPHLQYVKFSTQAHSGLGLPRSIRSNNVLKTEVI